MWQMSFLSPGGGAPRTRCETGTARITAPANSNPRNRTLFMTSPPNQKRIEAVKNPLAPNVERHGTRCKNYPKVFCASFSPEAACGVRGRLGYGAPPGRSVALAAQIGRAHV